MEETDRELLNLYNNGDTEAMGRLVEKYKRPLFSYIINMIGSNDDADEIFQEVWFKVIKKIRMYRQKNFFGWIIRIAHNIVIDRTRRKSPAFSLDEEIGDGKTKKQNIQGNDPGPLSLLEDKNIGKSITESILTLSTNQKEVFLMRVQSGLSFKEIAKIQKVSINTALARMQYALARLRPMLKDAYNEL